MIRKLQNKEIVFVIIMFILIGVCGILLLSNAGPWAIQAVRGCVPLEEGADLAQMEGTYVSYEARYPLGQYMEIVKIGNETDEKSEKSGKSRASYIVADEARRICLSIQIPVDKCGEMEKLSEVFFDALYGEAQLPSSGVMVKGTLERLAGEDLEYFREAMEEIGLSEEREVYHISDGMIQGNHIRTIYICSLAGLFLTGLTAVVLFLAIKELAGRR